MRSPGKGVMSATTQVKVLSPEIWLVALGQRFHSLEASIDRHVNGECLSACRGRSPWRANELFILELGRTLWLRKQASNKPERQGGGMAVG